MKKVWMILVGGLWILAGAQVFGSFEDKNQKKILEVLGQVGTMEQSCIVEYQGLLSEKVSDKKAFLKGAAEQAGFCSGNFQEDKEAKSLCYTAEDAFGSGRLILKEGEEGDCFLADFRLEEAETAFKVRENLNVFGKEYMEETGSSLNVIGSFDGKLTLAERNREADRLMKELNADIVSEHRTMELYTICAYTPDLIEKQIQNGKAVNVNIAMNYNEEKEKTYIYAAVPVIGLDY